MVLGDVCGKGLEAAVLTGKIRNTLQALLPLADDHQRLLGLLNGALHELPPHPLRHPGHGLRRPRAGGWSVCAHQRGPPGAADRARRRHGRAGRDPGHTRRGVLPEIQSTTARVALAPGETCLLFTDGITEARGGPLGDELFGSRGWRRALTQCAGMPAEAVVEHVQMLAAQWVGRGIHDDMATSRSPLPTTRT